ncbi:hypothetical protein, partial [Pseudomonas aeruginosa]|uniref:hypothetical protein n=1 Tax=Pseudomonas aeruginosa TaxID=287 RepID=UPI0021F0A54A
LVTKSAIRPGSNFNRQGGSIFHQRQQLLAQLAKDYDQIQTVQGPRTCFAVSYLPERFNWSSSIGLSKSNARY